MSRGIFAGVAAGIAPPEDLVPKAASVEADIIIRLLRKSLYVVTNKNTTDTERLVQQTERTEQSHTHSTTAR